LKAELIGQFRSERGEGRLRQNVARAAREAAHEPVAVFLLRSRQKRVVAVDARGQVVVHKKLDIITLLSNIILFACEFTRVDWGERGSGFPS
jgi:hypothetical protein